MTFRISLLLILITGFVLSCSTGPEFERDNMNDPENGQFTPDVGNLALSIDSSKNVTLIWNDISDFEDGFIIQKSYGNKESFFDLDTLPANSSKYIDSTKKLAVDTFYRVRSFSESSDSLGSTEIDELVLDPLESVSAPNTPGNQVSIAWETNSRGYADAFMIEKRLGSGDWAVLDTINNETQNYTFKENSILYKVDLRISALLLDYQDSFNSIKTIETRNININYPTNLTISFIDEATVSFSWKDNSNFNDTFIIYQRTGDDRNMHLSEWVEIDTLFASQVIKIDSSFNEFHQFGVRGTTNDQISRFSNLLTENNLSYAPEITNFEQLSETQVRIDWKDINAQYPNDTYSTHSFQVEVSINEGQFIQIANLPPTQKSYIVNNLVSQNNYKFRIKTYNSSTVKIMNVANLLSFSQSETYNFSFNDVKYSSISNDKRLIFTKKLHDSNFEVYNIGERTLTKYDTKIDNSDIGSDFISTNFFSPSPENNLIGFSDIYGNEITGSRELIFCVINYVTEELVQKTINYNYSEKEINILDFLSESKIIYYEKNTIADSTYIYEWDFKENITKKIHAYSGSFYTPKVFFDRANDLYFLNLINNVDIYRNNHTELSSFGDMDGFMKKIIHKEDTEYFVLDTYGIRIYLIDILSKNSSEIFHNRFLKDIVLVNNYNILVSNNSSVNSPYSSEIFFLNRDTHSVSLQKNINNKILSLSYNPNLDQLIMRNPSGYSFYDFNNLWEWVDN